jgi:hypothetical protein
VTPASCLLFLVALAIAQTGCTSIYSRTRTQFPPQPSAELSLRVAEARGAESLAEQSAAKLLDSLQRQKPAIISETDFDRLEAAAFDLERRVWAARDAAEPCGNSSKLTAEIKELECRAGSWLDYVQTHRDADVTTQVKKLQALLR